MRNVSMNESGCFTPKVSVIVPVYNPGQGISRCIESLRTQEMSEIEIIFIDDRGNDKSMEAVKAAAREDKRIRIISNPNNLGAGSSRNIGIEEARGEYLSFVDADDFISPQFLSLLYIKAKAEDSDIVKGTCVFCKDPGNGILQQRIRNEINNKIRQRIKDGEPFFIAFISQHWTALYRRELVLKHARYGNSRVGQDLTFQLQICMACHTFSFEEKALYYYVKRKGSAVNLGTKAQLYGYVDAFQQQCAFLESQCVNRQDCAKYVTALAVYLLRYLRFRSYEAELETTANHCQEEIRSIIIGLSFVWEILYQFEEIRLLVLYHVNPVLEVFSVEGEVQEPKEWMDIFTAGVELAKKYPGIYHRLLKKQLDHAYQMSARVITELMIKKGQLSEGAYYLNRLKEDKRRLETACHEKENIEVSVIVPFVSRGICIKKCIDSIINQSMKNLEIFFVDDRKNVDSDDLKQVSENDDRVVVFKTPVNLGRGMSRNIGIENARGKYLVFVEEKDYAEPEYIQSLFERAEATEADVVLSPLMKEKGEKVLFTDEAPFRCVKGGLYRRDYLIQEKIVFDKTDIDEDRLFNLTLAWNHPRVTYVSEAFYHDCPDVSSFYIYPNDCHLKQSLFALDNRLCFVEKQKMEYPNKDLSSYLMCELRHCLEMQVIAENMDISNDEKCQYFRQIIMRARRIQKWIKPDCFKRMIEMLDEYGINLVVSRFTEYDDKIRKKAYLQVCRNYEKAIDIYPAELVREIEDGFKGAYRNALACLQKMILSDSGETENYYKSIRSCYLNSISILRKKKILHSPAEISGCFNEKTYE